MKEIIKYETVTYVKELHFARFKTETNVANNYILYSLDSFDTLIFIATNQ
jgi:hypothetical protein